MLYHLLLPNSEYGHLMPQEDALAIGDDVYAVADGITRDPLGVKDFTGLSYEDLLQTYPQTSGAALAAQLFCRQFVREMSEQGPDPEGVRAAFVAANDAIARLNRQHIRHVDYLVKDYCGCTAAAGAIADNQLSWGVIGDCGIIVFNNRGQVKLQTTNGMETFEKYAPQIGFDWNKPEGRKLVRSRFRNNPNMIADGVCVAYGALTGEKPAEHFMDFGTQPLEPGDLIVFYSDGMNNIVVQREFFNAVYQNDPTIVDQQLLPYLERLAEHNWEHYGKERSMIALIHE